MVTGRKKIGGGVGSNQYQTRGVSKSKTLEVLEPPTLDHIKAIVALADLSSPSCDFDSIGEWAGDDVFWTLTIKAKMNDTAKADPASAIMRALDHLALGDSPLADVIKAKFDLCADGTVGFDPSDGSDTKNHDALRSVMLTRYEDVDMQIDLAAQGIFNMTVEEMFEVDEDQFESDDDPFV